MNRLLQLQGMNTAAKCWTLYTEHGLKQVEIAAALSINQGAVSRALKRAEAVALEKLRESVSAHKAHQLARLEGIYNLAMQSFQESKAPRVRKLSRMKGDETTTEIVHEEQAGDPRFLAEARGALSDIRKLLGLDAPIKLQQVEPNRPAEHLTDTEIEREMADLILKSGIDPARLLAKEPKGEM